MFWIIPKDVSKVYNQLNSRFLINEAVKSKCAGTLANLWKTDDQLGIILARKPVLIKIR